MRIFVIQLKNYSNIYIEESTKYFSKQCFFFFNYDKKGWEQDLIKFLNRPYKDILSDWEEKQKYRNQYDEEYFLSKKKEAGKIASKTILSSI